MPSQKTLSHAVCNIRQMRSGGPAPRPFDHSSLKKESSSPRKGAAPFASGRNGASQLRSVVASRLAHPEFMAVGCAVFPLRVLSFVNGSSSTCRACAANTAAAAPSQKQRFFAQKTMPANLISDCRSQIEREESARFQI